MTDDIEPRDIAPYGLEDYRRAPQGNSDLAGQWEDKPHRLLYDLIGYAKHQQRVIEELHARLDKAHQLDNRKTVALVDLRTALAPFVDGVDTVTPDDFVQAAAAYEKPYTLGLGDELVIRGESTGFYDENDHFYLALDNYKIELIPHQALYIAENMREAIDDFLKSHPDFAKTLRPADFLSLSPQEQWAVDKRLHLLDAE